MPRARPGNFSSFGLQLEKWTGAMCTASSALTMARERKVWLFVCLFVRETYTCSGLVRLVMRKMRWMLSRKCLKRTWYLEFRNCIVSPFYHPCRYRNEPALGRDLDPHGWWRGRREQYPNLVRLARKFLCVPATSTQAERVFSWMGFLLNKRRLSLSVESVSMQLFLKDNLKWTDFLFVCLKIK